MFAPLAIERGRSALRVGRAPEQARMAMILRPHLLGFLPTHRASKCLLSWVSLGAYGMLPFRYA